MLGLVGLMFLLVLDSCVVVDVMNEVVVVYGGMVDVNLVDDLGFMYICDFVDFDGYVWVVLWMDLVVILFKD